MHLGIDLGRASGRRSRGRRHARRSFRTTATPGTSARPRSSTSARTGRWSANRWRTCSKSRRGCRWPDSRNSTGSDQPVLTHHCGRGWPAGAVAALIFRKPRRGRARRFSRRADRARRDRGAGPLLRRRPAGDAKGRTARRPAGRRGGRGTAGRRDSLRRLRRRPAVGSSRTHDLGGGTFDATALRTGADGLDALATAMLDLGGKNFDEAVMGYVAGQFRAAHGYDPLLDPLSVPALRRHAERPQAPPGCSRPPGGPHVTPARRAGRDVVLTRPQFDRLDRPAGPTEPRPAGARLGTPARTGRPLTRSCWWAALRCCRAWKVRAAPPRQRRPTGCGGVSRTSRWRTAALIASQREAPRPACRDYDSGSRGADLGFQVLDPATRRPEIDDDRPQHGHPRVTSVTYYSNRADQCETVFDVVQLRDGGTPDALGQFAFVIARPSRNHPLEVTLGYDDRGLVRVTARDPESGTGR